MDKILGGWALSGIATYQSGTPFSILSNRGTLNRGARSTGRNTAYSTLTKAELDAKVGHLIMTGNGPYFVDPAIIGADGRGVGSDGLAPFSGQAFVNPGPGTVGNLQRRMFSGPWNLSIDNSLRKKFNITERHSLEFRADAFSTFNNPSFYVAADVNANVNGTQFGRLTNNFVSPRIMQFSLYYKF